jgi:hypothetical protein
MWAFVLAIVGSMMQGLGMPFYGWIFGPPVPTRTCDNARTRAHTQRTFSGLPHVAHDA